FRVVHDKLTSFDDNAEIARGNSAAALNRVGIYLGAIIATTGSLIGSPDSYYTNLGMFALDGVLALVVFGLARKVLDWLILPAVNNDAEIKGGNLAVAFAEACGYVGLGLVLCSAFSGDGAGLVEGLLSAVVFSFLGLVV